MNLFRFLIFGVVCHFAYLSEWVYVLLTVSLFEFEPVEESLPGRSTRGKGRKKPMNIIPSSVLTRTPPPTIPQQESSILPFPVDIVAIMNYSESYIRTDSTHSVSLWAMTPVFFPAKNFPSLRNLKASLKVYFWTGGGMFRGLWGPLRSLRCRRLQDKGFFPSTVNTKKKAFSTLPPERTPRPARCPSALCIGYLR